MRIGVVIEKMGYKCLPVIAVLDELVFEEVNEGALVLPFAEEGAPIVESNFGGRGCPGLVAGLSARVVIDVVKMVGWAVQEVRGAEDLCSGVGFRWRLRK